MPAVLIVSVEDDPVPVVGVTDEVLKPMLPMPSDVGARLHVVNESVSQLRATFVSASGPLPQFAVPLPVDTRRGSVIVPPSVAVEPSRTELSRLKSRVTFSSPASL